VTADDQRLLPYQSLSDLQTLVWDTPGFYAEGSDLYVHLAGGADPNGAAMVASRYNYAFYVEQDYIYFLELTFRHYGQGSYAKAIYFNNASDNLAACRRGGSISSRRAEFDASVDDKHPAINRFDVP